jgi:hypothetical protein
MKRLKLVLVILATAFTETVIAQEMADVAYPVGITRVGPEYRVKCLVQSACDAAIAKVCTKGHFATAWTSPLNFDFVCKAEELAGQPAIQVLISPECKNLFYGPDLVDVDASGKVIKTEKTPRPDYAPWDPARAIPMSYKDPRTSIAIYVESDGRHVAAMDVQGKLLWVRNPWEEAGASCPYRTPRPVVASLKLMELTEVGWSNLKARGADLQHRFLMLTFDSSQYGMLDETTGEFFPEGQN